jgi:hypothetical protein
MSHCAFGCNLMEWFKDLSDKLILRFLLATSSFGKELTAEGRREQEQWRDQRLRNLKGLSLRSEQRRSAAKR